MKKVISSQFLVHRKIFFFISMLILLLSLLRTTNYELPTIYAACDALDPNTARAGGLISTVQGITGIFTTTSGKCVLDTDAGINVNNLTFNRYKALYFSRVNPNPASSISKEPETFGPTSNGIDLSGKDKLYSINEGGGIDGDLAVTQPITGGRSGVIFVQGSLNIENDIVYNVNDAAIVFIVNKNIYISPDVQQVDAVLMAGGSIYTAGTSPFGCTTNSVTKKSDGITNIDQLEINGSLMTLASGNIIFCRDLGTRNAAVPAEKINFEAKYLVVLRDLLPYNSPEWSEVP